MPDAPHNRVVIVPESPGPLIPLEAGRRRERDELDLVIDELFPDDDEPPGLVDGGLTAVGAGLLIWALLTGANPGLIALAVVVLALGCILPARWLWRSARRRRAERLRTSLVSKGVPLDVSLPAIQQLAARYADVLSAARPVDAAAVSAAHGAVMEVASALRGRAPGSDRELAYVTDRVDAVAAVAQALATRASIEVGDQAIDTAAVLDARAELDGLSGIDSVRRLHEMAAEIRDERGQAN